MQQTRRNFLKLSGMAAVSTALFPELACRDNQVNTTTALQLYGVRHNMQKDPAGTLTRLAEMGYTHVEHANYVNHKFYGWTAKEFKKILDERGLKMPSGHTVLQKRHWDEKTNDFTGDWKKLVDDAAYMGQKFVISPSIDAGLRKNYDDFMHFMEVFNKCGELCQQSGMRFGYHNHHFEFSESLQGEKLFDLMMKNTDADKVVMQLDIGNMYIAGAHAKDVLEKYPGRYDNIHVKDMVRNEAGSGFESSILGKGVIGVREIIDLAREMGTRLFIIEQESYQGQDPLAAMKENLEVMTSWGY